MRSFVGDGRALAVMTAVWLIMSGSGCTSRAELISLREGMDQSTATIRQQHLEWAQLLSEGKQSELPTLSPSDYRAVLTAHQEYENLVNSSRAQDGGVGPESAPAVVAPTMLP